LLLLLVPGIATLTLAATLRLIPVLTAAAVMLCRTFPVHRLLAIGTLAALVLSVVVLTITTG
jgi:hypothetical protein